MMTRWKLRSALAVSTALAGLAVWYEGPNWAFAATAVQDRTTAPDGAGQAAQQPEDPALALFDPASVGRARCLSPDRYQAMAIQARLIDATFPMETQVAATPEPVPAPPLWDNLGTVAYPVSTKSDLAQRYFNQGLRWTYGFNHAEAARAFRTAQVMDPDCALCAWGEALVLGPNINAPMDPADNPAAMAAMARATALMDRSDEKERALIEALATRYAPEPPADRSGLDRAYAEAMAQVAARFPDDDTIAVLFAESVMDTQPWDYWEADGVTNKGRAGEAIDAVERVLARNPDHPGAIHLLIHLLEASTRPERAEPYADRLRGLVPGSGHLVHMPSHIYFRVGRYLDSMEANWKAAAADEAYIEQMHAQGLYANGYYPHNLHFLLESARMAGDGATALEAANRLGHAFDYKVAKQAPWVQVIMVAPYFAETQFGTLDRMMAFPEPVWDFPYVKAMRHYGRGMMLAMAGRLDEAEAERAAVAGFRETGDWSGMAAAGIPAQDLVRIAERVLAGKMAQHAGRLDDAIAAYREAADVQDALPYLEPPMWYYPVRQSLGVALLMAGRADEAERELWRSLVAFPNNAYGLYALAEVHRMQGDEAAAAYTDTLFRRAWAGSGPAVDMGAM